MAKSTFQHARIRGIVTVVPPNKKYIDDEIDKYGGDINQINRIKKTIGLNQRHVVGEKTTTADLCLEAALKLIEGLNFSVNSIDGLILVTQTPDYIQPFTAAVIHGKLNLDKSCAAFDVNLGCSGYVYGLWLASMMVETRTCSNVLLLAGDTISKSINPMDRSVAPLFGDAGTATLIQYSTEKTKSYFSLHTDGKGFNHIIIPAGGYRTPKSTSTSEDIIYPDGNIRNQENLHMNGAEVFNFSIKEEPPAIREILEYSGTSAEDINYIIFHQANKYIISNIVRRLQMPLDKAPNGTVEKYGNQSSASIPATICDAIKDLVENSNQKLVLSGFGVGLSWATCLIELEHIYCPEIIIFEEESV